MFGTENLDFNDPTIRDKGRACTVVKYEAPGAEIVLLDVDAGSITRADFALHM